MVYHCCVKERGTYKIIRHRNCGGVRIRCNSSFGGMVSRACLFQKTQKGEKMDRECFWKIRDSYICNVKAFFMLLVITGHLLECKLENETIRFLYKLIYSVHMPLFAYVTGLGAKSISRCRKQCISSLRYYLLIQGSVMLYFYVIKGSRCHLLTPYWHVWFLLAMVWWSLGGWLCLYLKKKGIPWAVLTIGAMAGACLCGAVTSIGRFLSLSRAIVFFPYYVMGMCGLGEKLPVKKTWSLLALIPAILGIDYITSHVSYVFLYQAAGFGMGRLWTGITGRLVCMLTAISLGSLFLAWIPQKKLLCTKLGIDTLPVYIFHVCFVPLAEPLYDLFGYVIPVAVVLSAVIMFAIYGFTRFFRPVCRLQEPMMLPLTLAHNEEAHM